MSGAMLVLVPSVHAIREDGRIRMDDKFVAGLHLTARDWGGPMRVVMREGTGTLPFSRVVAPEDLPCALTLIAADAPVLPGHLEGAAVVLGAADDHRQYDLPAACRTAGVKLVYAIEYTLGTRLAVARLEGSRNPLRLARRIQWTLSREMRLRRALRSADGLQANGYPAWRAYGGLTANGCLYLDNRSLPETMATEPEMAARAAHAGPLRLVHAGRLIAMKGTQDLVPLALALHRGGTEFTLDIFGAGKLRDQMAGDIARHGLAHRIRLHAPVDFATELVPWMRRNADLFIAPHRQSDPSCSYLEAMGCGVPVLGTDNRMWSELARHSGGGWVTPSGRPDRAAELISGLSRADLAGAAGRALDFARAHDVRHEFGLRMDHLRRIAGLA